MSSLASLPAVKANTKHKGKIVVIGGSDVT
jgi:hypothetical protein